MSDWMDRLWDDVVGDVEWLKEVVLGEFDENRPTSAMVADLLASFVPGVIIVTSARDLVAVSIRLVRHPERREEVTQWMLIVGCVIPLAAPLIGAAAGAIIGGIAGSEAGAALRAVALMLIEHGGEMLEKLLLFLRKFIKGDIIAVLKDIKFVHFADACVTGLREFFTGIRGIIQKLTAQLMAHPTLYGFVVDVESVLKKLRELEHAFLEVQTLAVRKIPEAMKVFDQRLAQALAGESKALEHSVTPMVHAPKPKVVPVEPQRVPAMQGNPLGHPAGVEPVKGEPPATEPKTNLHPQTTEEPAGESAEARLIAQRRQTAKDFYKRMGWSDEKIDSHMQGIDFSKPVDVVTLTPEDSLVQYQVPGRPTGNYFAPEGTSPESIGVDPTGRVAQTFSPTQNVEVLQSTAADTSGNLSLPANARGAGGGTQYFATDPSLFGVH